MPADQRRAQGYIETILQHGSVEEWKQKLAPKLKNPKEKLEAGHSLESLEKRWHQIPGSPEGQRVLADDQTLSERELYRHNIEYFIGTVKLPVGIAGPLRVNGLHAQGDYYLPLATTEAALVASYNRGAQLISEAGGCTAILLNEGISRAPGFMFKNLIEVAEFLAWVIPQIGAFKSEVEKTTQHGKLIDMKVTVEGNHVYLNFEFSTGEASGQNMVTIATQSICNYILANSPVHPEHSYIEANFSGDKKASAQSFLSVRGKKVTAEVFIPKELIEKRLSTTPEEMANYWHISGIGSVLSGTIGIQGHYANGLAALYIACGQDAACVAESSIGLSRFEVTEDGSLYASVTLPNIMVGIIGGGTGLPSQKACLEIVSLKGPLKTRTFAEVVAALCLAGEISIIGALSSGNFSRAHQRLARGRRKADGKA